MKIAIVHTHPLPLAIGGAENLWWGMQEHIEALTPHSCELVTMGSPERSFWDLVDSYEGFSRRDMRGYDMVISGKYPAWMVSHPNHVCFLQHRLRGLYDTYPSTPGADRMAQLDPQARELMTWMRTVRNAGPLDTTQRDRLFDRLRALRSEGLSEATLRFPGPFIRSVVHFLDDCALTTRSIRRFMTQSDTVRRRAHHFPNDADVTVVHPPCHRDDYRCGSDEYFFTSSRLDGPKRVASIIRAMQHVDADVPLLIAGSGPQDAELRELAADDPRIRFLGFVDDDAMPGLYADAIAVPFVPAMEDYGLVAVEAMKSGKPVLTFEDSGGPCELVQDGVTGFVTPTSAEALGEKLAYLATHRDEAREMGRRARDSVAHINWEAFIEQVVGYRKPATRPKAGRPKMTVAATFPIWPPRGGGQARVFHIYRNLARHYDVDVVSFTAPAYPAMAEEIAPGLREIRIDKSARHDHGERAYSTATGYIALTDVAMPSLAPLTPHYQQALELSAADSFAIVACHPYLIGEVKHAAPRLPLLFEAQDVEFVLKAHFAKRGAAGQMLLNDTIAAERASWREANLVFACAERDLKQLEGEYGPTLAQQLEVPNGVPIEETVFTDVRERRRRQADLGLPPRSTVLFMGSWHGPNIESARHVLGYARAMPEVTFLIMGSAGMALKEEIPANARVLGEVSHEMREALLASADVALNPTFSGSGTNVKMLDYFASGIPVVSTPFGGRGLAVTDGVHLKLAEDADFPGAIGGMLHADEDALAMMVTAARRLVEERYSWSGIADRFNETIVARWLS